MSKLLNGALILTCLSACNSSQVTLARPSARSAHVSQGLSSGYSGTATFDAPVVNPNTWQGSPIGTGTWSTTATPPLSGGPQGIGFYDNSAGSTMHYLIVGNLTAPTGTFFGIIADGQTLALGTSTINNTTLYAGIFDAATGDPVALASSGTLTLTAAGLIGGRITGTFSGTLDDVVNTGCSSSAQCAPGEQCLNGSCIRTGCTSNAQCPTGQTCQTGQCVPTPQCTTNAQCGAGQICQAGVCVNAPGCTSNAQCASGQVCQNGACVTAPGCVTDAQCGPGNKCQAGQCVPVTPATCDGQQGTGSYAGKSGSANVCSVLGNTISVSNAAAAIGDDGSGLALFVMDATKDAAGAILPLTACPSAAGVVTVQGAVFWEQAASGGATFYAQRPATSATIVFTKVGARTMGDFHLTLAGGSTVNGDFDVQ